MLTALKPWGYKVRVTGVRGGQRFFVSRPRSSHRPRHPDVFLPHEREEVRGPHPRDQAPSGRC